MEVQSAVTHTHSNSKQISSLNQLEDKKSIEIQSWTLSSPSTLGN